MMSHEQAVDDNLERRDIDGLTILQATEILVDYCLTGQDEESTYIASKMIVEGLYVAVGMTRDESLRDRNERWVHRMRLSRFSNPFGAYSGLDVWLPYGAAMCSELPEVGELGPVDTKSSRSGVFVSYAEGQKYWNARELRPTQTERPFNYWRNKERNTFDLLENTVGEVDKSIIADSVGKQKSGIGFILKEAISLVDQGYIGLLTFEHQNGIDFRIKRRNISEIIADILFV